LGSASGGAAASTGGLADFFGLPLFLGAEGGFSFCFFALAIPNQPTHHKQINNVVN
jgi:hypothetical protein